MECESEQLDMAKSESSNLMSRSISGVKLSEKNISSKLTINKNAQAKRMKKKLKKKSQKNIKEVKNGNKNLPAVQT